MAQKETKTELEVQLQTEYNFLVKIARQRDDNANKFPDTLLGEMWMNAGREMMAAASAVLHLASRLGIILNQ